eukprot:Sdes_comp9026_c0_seq1m452
MSLQNSSTTSPDIIVTGPNTLRNPSSTFQSLTNCVGVICKENSLKFAQRALKALEKTLFDFQNCKEEFSPEEDQLLLSYFDCDIRVEDLNILLSSAELMNDRIIAFYFEFLTHNLFENFKDQILFLPPTSSFFIAQSSSYESASLILNQVDFMNKELVFIPVNDQINLDRAGGSH